MADEIFNTSPGATIARELQITYLNTGTFETPVWSPLGKRVEESKVGYDWGEETKQDILGNTHSSMKKPVLSQAFDPCNLDSGDSAVAKVWELGVHDQDNIKLANMDLLLVHFYAGNTTTPFAERYPSSMVKPTDLGGAGAGNMEMPIEITFGGARQTGTASKAADGKITFTPEGASIMSTYGIDDE